MTAEHECTQLTAELAAAMLDLDAAHRREADLAAELIEARGIIAEQQQQIEVHQHAAVLALEAYRRVVAERDALVGRLVGGLAVWCPVGSRN